MSLSMFSMMARICDSSCDGSCRSSSDRLDAGISHGSCDGLCEHSWDGLDVGIYECSCDSSSCIGSWDTQKHFARILATASEKDIAKGRLSEFERVLSLSPARVPETCWVLECGKGTCDVIPDKVPTMDGICDGSCEGLCKRQCRKLNLRCVLRWLMRAFLR